MTNIEALPQKVVDREIVVLKGRIDLTMARLLGEIVKRKFFVRLGLFRPKPEEIQLISIDKYYEPYIVVGGKYAVDYCKSYVFHVNVNEKMESLVILGKKFKPEPSSGAVKLEGEGHFHYEDQAYFILDRTGREVVSEQLSYAPFEEEPKNLEEISRKSREIKISHQQEIEFLRSRIANRPSGVDEVTKEWFEINQRTVIYVPKYELIFQNAKTGKEVIAQIDGVTGKIIHYRKS